MTTCRHTRLFSRFSILLTSHWVVRKGPGTLSLPQRPPGHPVKEGIGDNPSTREDPVPDSVPVDSEPSGPPLSTCVRREGPQTPHTPADRRQQDARNGQPNGHTQSPTLMWYKYSERGGFTPSSEGQVPETKGGFNLVVRDVNPSVGRDGTGRHCRVGTEVSPVYVTIRRVPGPVRGVPASCLG